jgi:protein required for attachment to host cells
MSWWILVADAARARVSSTTGPRDPLHLERELLNPHGRERPQEIVTDDPGRHGRGAVGRSPSQTWSTTSPDVVEERRFAQKLADALGTALARHEYESLAIAAPAHFLGMLRQAVDPQVHKHLVNSVAKDLTAVKEHELPKFLQPVFATTHA